LLPLFRLLGEHFLEHRIERLRRVGANRSQRGNRLLAVQEDLSGHGLAAVGGLAGEQIV